MVDGGSLDLFVLLGPTLQDSIRQYVNLTGTPHLPQVSFNNDSQIGIRKSAFFIIELIMNMI